MPPGDCKKERKKEIRPEAWVQETLPEAGGGKPGWHNRQEGKSGVWRGYASYAILTLPGVRHHVRRQRAFCPHLRVDRLLLCALAFPSMPVRHKHTAAHLWTSARVLLCNKQTHTAAHLWTGATVLLYSTLTLLRLNDLYHTRTIGTSATVMLLTFVLAPGCCSR